MSKLIIKIEKEVLFDEEDSKKVKLYNWFLNPFGYAVAHTGKKLIYMHRLIMNPQDNHWIDHKNRDKTDNRKSNLRICTPSQSRMNSKKQTPSDRELTSQYKGVRKRKDVRSESRVWTASIKGSDKKYHLGSFKTELEAAQAYDQKAYELFGEFAKLNFPNN